ncbi:MAG: GGDEF domain-containing response regulator [Kiloniellaceae bacterium]
MNGKLRILIVDDDEVDRRATKRHLAETGLDVVTHETATAEDCLKLLKVTAVDCILLDYRLPEMSGIDFLVKLSGDRGAGRPAIVMQTGSGNEQLVVQAMRLGVQDYLVKGEFTAEILEAAIVHSIETAHNQRKAEAESLRLEELALFDSLTKIGNRNLFAMRLEHSLNLAQRQGESICLLYMDLDRFKEINDTLGHAAGDVVLCRVAERLKDVTRDADTLVRLGGDEFAIIMETGVSVEGARHLINRIEHELSKPIEISGQDARVGVSIGSALFPQDADCAESLVHAADVAMYEAKFGGRPDRELKVRSLGG